MLSIWKGEVPIHHLYNIKTGCFPLRKRFRNPQEADRSVTIRQCYSCITSPRNLLLFVFSSAIMQTEQTRKIPRLPGIDTAKASRGMYTV